MVTWSLWRYIFVIKSLDVINKWRHLIPKKYVKPPILRKFYRKVLLKTYLYLINWISFLLIKKIWIEMSIFYKYNWKRIVLANLWPNTLLYYKIEELNYRSFVLIFSIAPMLRERCRFSLTSVGQVLYAVGGSGGSSDDLENFDADGHQVEVFSNVGGFRNLFWSIQSNSVITNSIGPSVFVCHSRDIVITVNNLLADNHLS